MPEAKQQRVEFPAGQDLTGTMVGRFAVGARLGHGGMGEVYKAEDTLLKRTVALKRLAPQLRADERYRQRFLKEAERASSLTHQRIAAIYDVMEENGEPFLVMEYVEGSNLRSLLSGPIPLPQFFPIAIQSAEALVAAHEKHIVHRDIKPENIMLTSTGHLKVLDFGVAKRLPRMDDATPETTAPQVAGLSGTPAYMAPEVLLGQDADGRADIFSLGVVFYESLAGIQPFKTPNLVSTTDRILHDVPPPLARANPNVPRHLGELVDKMLAKQPAQRQSSAAELLEDLHRARNEDLRTLNFPPVGAVPKRKPGIRMATIGQALILVLAAAVIAYVAIQRWFKPAPPSLTSHAFFLRHNWVVVADFENQTGDRLFDQTLRELLTTSLEQSRYVNVFPSSSIQEVLKLMERPAGSRIDEKVGREICQREGLQGLVLGSIGQIGDAYSITLRAVDPQGNLLTGEKEVAQGKSAILPALDRLAGHLREQLGESLGAIEQNADPLERVTSKSLEALRSYSLAKKELYAGKFAEAQELMQQAIQKDPQFAMAYEYLAVIQFDLQHVRAARQNLQKAVQLTDHLTERERQKILGDYNSVVTRDLPQAITHYRLLLDLYPDDYAAHNNLAQAYENTRQFDQAIAEEEAALRVLDTAVAHQNLAFEHFLAGRVDQSIKMEEENLKSPVADPIGYYNLGVFHLTQGDFASAEGYFRKFGGMGETELADSHEALADLDWSQGRYAAARSELDAAVGESKGRAAEARARLHRADLLLERKDPGGAIEEALRAASLTGEPDQLAWASSVLAQAGGRSENQAILSRLEALPVKSWAMFARAGILLASGNSSAAVEASKGAADFQTGTLGLELEARALHAAHQLPDAVAIYSQILARKTERADEEADAPAFHRVVLAYYQLGLLHQEMGHAALAQENLSRFLNFFQKADAPSALASDAQKRLQELRHN